jgi:hypothetical protein
VLDALLDRVVAEALEPALARCGVPVDEELCIRAVRAPVRLRLEAGDAAAAAAWAAAIAEEIAALLAAGSPDVVRFRSPRAALADLALGVATGRLERVWAWRRLGLWRGSDLPGDRAAAEELIAALAREPEAIAPVLATVARAGALGRLLVTVSPTEWTSLAASALGAASLSSAARDAALPGGLTPSRDTCQEQASSLPGWDDGGQSPSHGIRRADRSDPSEAATERIVRASALARAALGARAEPALRAALAVLAALEVEPALLVARPPAEVRALTASLAAALAAAGDRPAGDAERRAAPERSPAPVAADPRTALGEPGVPAAARHERKHATAHGGLLFLLAVLDALELPPMLAARPRPLRWTLHLLALALAPLEPDDPAALAFAGLPPDAEPPVQTEPPEPEELEAATVLARGLAEHVWERLGAVEATPAEALEFVVRRRGEIVFEPGWIELRLALDEVSIELRRAGLDLDPGWLPWLGAVIRFVYA